MTNYLMTFAMPELPEVETLRLQLFHLIVGLTIKDIEVLNPKSFAGDKKLILGTKVQGVRRFAKILVIDLACGLSLAVHLKMSGQLIYKIKDPACAGRQKSKIRDIKRSSDELLANLPNKHTRVIITFSNKDKLFFNDMRKFGWIKIISNIKNQISNSKLRPKMRLESLDNFLNKLGPEPMRDLTAEKFREILKTSKRPIKLVLMDQGKISGVGNIYANEALFLAGIYPKNPSNKLSKQQAEILYSRLLQVLKDGIRWRGASQNHFRDALGQKGEVQEHFYVYDREGEFCTNNCGSKIKRIKLGGRGTFYCPKCQK